MLAISISNKSSHFINTIALILTIHFPAEEAETQKWLSPQLSEQGQTDPGLLPELFITSPASTGVHVLGLPKGSSYLDSGCLWPRKLPPSASLPSLYGKRTGRFKKRMAGVLQAGSTSKSSLLQDWTSPGRPCRWRSKSPSLWGNVGARGSPHCGSEGKLAYLVKPLGSLMAPGLGFSQMFSFCRFAGTSQDSPSFLGRRFAFSGSDGSVGKPAAAWCSGSIALQTSNCLFPEQGLCPPLYWLCSFPRLIFSQVPREPLLWQIPLGFTGPRGGAAGPLGTAPQSPTLGAVCKRRAEGAGGQPGTGCSCYRIVCGVRVLSQPTCLRAERCEKLETKMVPAEWGGAFLHRKEGNTSVGFYFSPPLHPKNTKRLSVFNANVGFKSFRFGLTRQEKKKIWQAFRYDAEKLFSPQFRAFICKSQRPVDWIVGASVSSSLTSQWSELAAVSPSRLLIQGGKGKTESFFSPPPAPPSPLKEIKIKPGKRLIFSYMT